MKNLINHLVLNNSDLTATESKVLLLFAAAAVLFAIAYVIYAISKKVNITK